MMVSHRAFVLGQPGGPLHVFIAFLDRATNYRAMHVMLAGIVQVYYIRYLYVSRTRDAMMMLWFRCKLYTRSQQMHGAHLYNIHIRLP